jgi:hypothetical protein
LTCFSRDGACSEEIPCPYYFGAFDPVCSVGGCRVPAVASSPLGAPFGPITLLEPKNAAQVASLNELTFSWSLNTDAAVALFITSNPDRTPTDTNLLWELWRAPGDPSQATFADGISRLPSTELTQNRDVLLFGEAFKLGHTIGQTAGHVVRVGPAWSTANDACDPQHPCRNPSLPLTCVAGLCRILCASAIDCRAYAALAGLEGVQVCSTETSRDGRYCTTVAD